MKNIVTILCISLFICGCGNKPKVIPDKEMSAIIRDIMITNSYSGTHVSGIYSDTLDIYTPVLKKYGYNDRDFRYTLGKLQTKKSARITEIIDVAIADITVENDYFTARKNIRNRIDSMIMARYKDTVYVMNDAKIKITTLNVKDKERVTVTVPVVEGTYAVKYGYKVDSMDKNIYSLMKYTITDSTDKVTRVNSMSLIKGEKKKIEFKVETTPRDRKLVIKLVDFNEKSLKPNVTFDSIYVVYNQPIAVGRKRLAEELIDFKGFFNSDLYLKNDTIAPVKDSLKVSAPKELWRMVK